MIFRPWNVQNVQKQCKVFWTATTLTQTILFSWYLLQRGLCVSPGSVSDFLQKRLLSLAPAQLCLSNFSSSHLLFMWVCGCESSHLVFIIQTQTRRWVWLGKKRKVGSVLQPDGKSNSVNIRGVMHLFLSRKSQRSEGLGGISHGSFVNTLFTCVKCWSSLVFDGSACGVISVGWIGFLFRLKGLEVLWVQPVSFCWAFLV